MPTAGRRLRRGPMPSTARRMAAYPPGQGRPPGSEAVERFAESVEGRPPRRKNLGNIGDDPAVRSAKTKNPISLEQESNGLDARSAQPVVSPVFGCRYPPIRVSGVTAEGRFFVKHKVSGGVGPDLGPSVRSRAGPCPPGIRALWRGPRRRRRRFGVSRSAASCRRLPRMFRDAAAALEAVHHCRPATAPLDTYPPILPGPVVHSGRC